MIGILGTAAQLAFAKPFKFIPTAEGSMVYLIAREEIKFRRSLL